MGVWREARRAQEGEDVDGVGLYTSDEHAMMSIDMSEYRREVSPSMQLEIGLLSVS